MNAIFHHPRRRYVLPTLYDQRFRWDHKLLPAAGSHLNQATAVADAVGHQMVNMIVITYFTQTLTSTYS